jgi:hypothetical protein
MKVAAFSNVIFVIRLALLNSLQTNARALRYRVAVLPLGEIEQADAIAPRAHPPTGLATTLSASLDEWTNFDPLFRASLHCLSSDPAIC